MLKHPSVRHTVGKGARILVKEERQEKKKADKIQKLFGQKSIRTTKRFLSWNEFYAINLYTQLSLNYMIFYYDQALIHGALYTVFANVFLTVIMGIPLMIVSILLGNYSKKSYLRVWQMVPMFSGIGWSVSIFQFFTECFNISAAGMALLYIPDLFQSPKYQNCTFEYVSSDCVPIKMGNAMRNCCSILTELQQEQPDCLKKKVNFASLDFFRKYRLQMIETEQEGFAEIINWNWVVSVGVIWFIIYMFMVQDFARFKRIILYVSVIVVIISIVPILVIVFTAKNYYVPDIIDSRASHLLNFRSFTGLIDNVVGNSLPSNMVFFGATISSDKTPPVVSAVLCGFKLVMMTVLLNWMSMSISMVKKKYDVASSTCFQIFGYDYVFAIVPDALGELYFSRFWLFVWYFYVFLWGTFTGLISSTAFIDTLTDRFPKLLRFRLCTCTMLCSCSFMINCLLLNKHYLTIYYSWVFKGYHISALTLGVLFLISLYVYTMQKLTTDYLFHYGVPLKNLWIVCLKYTSLVVVGCMATIAYAYLPKLMPFPDTDFIGIVIIVISVAVLLPIPFFMIYYYIKFSRISQLSKYYIHSLPLWGPPTTEEKQARKCFNPQRQLRYKVVLKKCKHNCLLNSTKLQDEVERLNENTRLLFESLENKTEEVESTTESSEISALLK